tara:strand:+ start:3238 stop:3414 length:177 start_codon:yes stop_codon:yes gene_type:complete
MKVKLKTELLKDGVTYDKGCVMDVSDASAEVWIAKGWASKEEKGKKETKELKQDKETK